MRRPAQTQIQSVNTFERLPNENLIRPTRFRPSWAAFQVTNITRLGRQALGHFQTSEKIRWGIIGTGNIARKFAEGLGTLPDSQLIAVGSRARDTADSFGDLFHVKDRFDSYEELANDPDVDVVYVSTPNNLHKENTLMCLRAGKSVLCEKPFAINAQETAEMISLARQRGLFLMEAMWTRFLPAIVKLREILDQKTIGEVRMLFADFGFRSEMNPKSRIFDPSLGGGALLDVGIYPLSLASMIFGTPSRITGMAHIGETGVDEQSAVILGYNKGELALIAAAARTHTPQVAHLLGTGGRVIVDPPFWRPQTLTLSVDGRTEETKQIPFEGNGYSYEAAEVNRCLRERRTESDTMPLDETLSIMETMDAIRSQWGLKYPHE